MFENVLLTRCVWQGHALFKNVSSSWCPYRSLYILMFIQINIEFSLFIRKAVNVFCFYRSAQASPLLFNQFLFFWRVPSVNLLTRGEGNGGGCPHQCSSALLLARLAWIMDKDVLINCSVGFREVQDLAVLSDRYFNAFSCMPEH